MRPSLACARGSRRRRTASSGRGAGYRLTEPAQDDLLALAVDIAQDSIAAAERVVNELEAAMESLAEMPRKGHAREDLTDEPDLSFRAVRSYLIVYRAESSPIEVVRILHGNRDVGAGLAP